MDKPKNPYKPGTAIYRVMDEDWSNMTTEEIAATLGTVKRNVYNSLFRIRDETGYEVPYISMRGKIKTKYTKIKH